MKTAIEILNSVEPNGELLDTEQAIQAMELFAKEKTKELIDLVNRAANLVGNPGTNISSSTDIACDNWQRDYEVWLIENQKQ